MSTRRRLKSSRYPGSKTHGRGRKNRTRGSGNRGGVGMSGTGKRGDQKKTMVIGMYGNDYFGKDARGAGSRLKKKPDSMSLQTLAAQLSHLVKDGKAHEQKGTYEIDLMDYKLIGNDASGMHMHIRAKSASAGAVQAVERAGGSVTVVLGEKTSDKKAPEKKPSKKAA